MGRGWRWEAASSRRRENRNDDELIRALALLSLENAPVNRELVASVMTSALMDVEYPMIQAGLLEGQDFAKNAKDNPGKDVGSPHVRIAVASLLSLNKTPELDPAFKESFSIWWKENIADKTPDDIAKAVSVWKIRKPQK